MPTSADPLGDVSLVTLNGLKWDKISSIRQGSFCASQSEEYGDDLRDLSRCVRITKTISRQIACFMTLFLGKGESALNGHISMELCGLKEETHSHASWMCRVIGFMRHKTSPPNLVRN